MKHVFTDPSAVAHLWANQLQEDAKTSGGNFFFNRKAIYSYGHHFPIARHVEFEGKKTILFTTRTYSSTTAKHIMCVRHACNHLEKIYCKDPDCGTQHSVNLNDFIRRIEEQAGSLLHARKPEIYIGKIQEIVFDAKTYLAFFNLPVSEVMQAAFDITDKGKYLAYATEKAELIQKEFDAKQALLKAQHKKELKEWLSGKKDRLYNRVDYDYLRIKNGRIQTSQNVELPIELGKRLYQQIKDRTLLVGDKVLSYDVLWANGEYKIGCHTFTRKYLLDFGKKFLTA